MDGYLETTDDKISALGNKSSLDSTQTRDNVIDCNGMLLMPGLINGHNHSAMTLFRGLADDLDLSTWLHDHIFPAEQTHVSREMVYWCTRLAAAEMILSGTTCVADAYFFSSEAARALADCGMRAVVGHGIVDFPAPSVPDPKKNISTVAEFLDEWREATPLITPAVFAHAPYTCSPHTLMQAKALAEEHGVRFFTHIAESRKEPEMIIELQAKTPLGHLAALDILDDNSVMIHTIWLDEEDLDILTESGTHVITCPQSNLKLGSGIAPVAEMISRGVTVGIGTDGCASNNALDLFREMDILAKLHKLHHLEATALPAQEILRTATTGNAKALGLPKTGYLRVGNMADLILIDLQKPHLTPFYNSDLLVYAASGSDVCSTMINGKMVMENRKITSFDLNETVAKVQEMAESVHD